MIIWLVLTAGKESVQFDQELDINVFARRHLAVGAPHMVFVDAV